MLRYYSPRESSTSKGLYFFNMELTCKKCGLIDKPEIRVGNIHTTAYCTGCHNYIKHLPPDNRSDFELYFGKYKGRNIKSMLESKEERDYLLWLHDKATTVKQWQKILIRNLLHL